MQMSAARPDPGLPEDGSAGAEVIPIHPRRGDRVPDQTAPDPETRDPQAELTATVESLYLSHRRTLTDPDTAAAFRIAMEAVLLMLEGAAAQGVVEEEQYNVLRGMAEGMRRVPDGL